MSDIWITSLPILLVDIANPVLLAAVLVCLSSARPFAASLTVLSGHMTAYFLAGVFVVEGLADILAEWLAPFVERFNNPVPGDYIIGALLGALFLIVALRWKTSPPKPSQEEPKPISSSLVGIFGFGAVINFIGIPFALPYFAFINQLFKLDVDHKIPALLIYNLAYSVPFLLLPLALALFGKSIMPLLQTINQGVEKVSAYILPVIFGLLGAFMIADALLFFVTGHGLV